MKTFKEYLKEWDAGEPKIYPCPVCYEPNKLTAKEKRLGSKCDACEAQGRCPKN